jgi:hypothetical protein
VRHVGCTRSRDFGAKELDVYVREQAALIARQMVINQAPCHGEHHTWPEAHGVQVNGRREAAARMNLA